MSRHKRKLGLVGLTAFASVGLLVVLHTLLASEPLPPNWAPTFAPVERDLSEIAEDGVLRVAVCRDEVGYSEEGGQPHGLAYDLASRLARRLGVQLEPVVVPTPATGLRDVIRGKADILAVIDPGPAPVNDQVVWTAPIEMSEPVVVGPSAGSIRRLSDLAGKTIAVPKKSFFEATALRWQERSGGKLTVQALPAVLNPRELADGVARGSWPLVLMDRDRARLEVTAHPGLGISAQLDEPIPVRWALRPNAPQLARISSKVLEDMRILGWVAELERTYFEDPGSLPTIRRRSYSPETGGLTPWDGLFKQAAHSHGLDWRLVAALSRAESGHDPRQVGPGGSLGLMQLMPGTARAFGATDPLDPEQNVQAGARHLRWLFDQFLEVDENDRLAFALAAYNLGLAHIEDARALALERGLSPDRWGGHVAEMMPLLEDRAIAAKLQHGLARGRITREYVRRVLELYSGYRGDVPPTRTAQAGTTTGS